MNVASPETPISFAGSERSTGDTPRNSACEGNLVYDKLGSGTNGGHTTDNIVAGFESQDIINARDILSAVPKPQPKWRSRFMKMLIVGETGQGKTTFIKNLFASYSAEYNMKVNDISAPTSLAEFQKNPKKLCTEILIKDTSLLINYHFLIQDTPGYDNMEVNMDPILKYIRNCNDEALSLEQDSKRHSPLYNLLDPRVDICVYFLSPHRIKPIDVQFITELSNFVPVIPVLAKADSMTAKELLYFKDLVSKTMKQASKSVGRDIIFNFTHEQLCSAGMRSGSSTPFAIVASNTSDNSVKHFWPVRVYPWGKCEAYSNTHSDLGVLKKLIFEVMYEEFKQLTELRYHAYRQSMLFNVDDRHRPLHILTLSEQLNCALKSNKKNSLAKVLGYTSRQLLNGLVIYIAISILSGQNGQKRLLRDFAVVKGKAFHVAESVVGKASTTGDLFLAKGKEVGKFTKEVANELKGVKPVLEKPRKRGFFGFRF